MAVCYPVERVVALGPGDAPLHSQVIANPTSARGRMPHPGFLRVDRSSTKQTWSALRMTCGICILMALRTSGRLRVIQARPSGDFSEGRGCGISVVGPRAGEGRR